MHSLQASVATRKSTGLLTRMLRMRLLQWASCCSACDSAAGNSGVCSSSARNPEYLLLVHKPCTHVRLQHHLLRTVIAF